MGIFELVFGLMMICFVCFVVGFVVRLLWGRVCLGVYLGVSFLEFGIF